MEVILKDYSIDRIIILYTDWHYTDWCWGVGKGAKDKDKKQSPFFFF